MPERSMPKKTIGMSNGTDSRRSVKARIPASRSYIVPYGTKATWQYLLTFFSTGAARRGHNPHAPDPPRTPVCAPPVSSICSRRFHHRSSVALPGDETRSFTLPSINQTRRDRLPLGRACSDASARGIVSPFPRASGNRRPARVTNVALTFTSSKVATAVHLVRP
jgi:hypothetical protein